MTFATNFPYDDEPSSQGRRAESKVEALERRARALADASRRLSRVAGYEATVSLAAELPVPLLGDACAVDVRKDGAVRRAAAYARDGLEPSARDAIPALSGDLVPRVFDAQEAIVSPATLVVPLVAAERVVGALTVVAVDPSRLYARDDLAFAEDLAARLALAIDHASLVRAHDETLSVLTHDLKNPLNVIVFAVASLRRAQLDDAQRAACVDKLGRAAERMNRLLVELRPPPPDDDQR